MFDDSYSQQKEKNVNMCDEKNECLQNYENIVWAEIEIDAGSIYAKNWRKEYALPLLCPGRAKFLDRCCIVVKNVYPIFSNTAFLLAW